jgi:fructose-1,6-bisphosphatase/inositol monophosphatase family enzyme
MAIDEEFTNFIRTLAEKSGEVIRPYFDNPGLILETKEDQTIVTQADRDAEGLMRELIRKTYPDHGIIGEEFGAENVCAEFVWVLDTRLPIVWHVDRPTPSTKTDLGRDP